MADNLSYHVAAFSEKVRVMNQTGSKNLTMSAAEARNLQADIFSLLSKLVEFSSNNSHDTIKVEVDGGEF